MHSSKALALKIEGQGGGWGIVRGTYKRIIKLNWK